MVEKKEIEILVIVCYGWWW